MRIYRQCGLLHSKCWVSIDGDNDILKKYFCKIRNNDYEKIPNKWHNYEKILGKSEDLMENHGNGKESGCVGWKVGI